MTTIESLFLNTSLGYKLRNDIVKLQEENEKLKNMCINNTLYDFEIIESELPSPALSRRSSISEFEFEKKYLKYKQKYLQLKNNL